MTKLKIRASVPDILFLNAAVSFLCLVSFDSDFWLVLLITGIPVLLYGYLCILVRKPETRTKKSLLLRKIQTIIPTILVFAVAVWVIVSGIREGVFSDIFKNIAKYRYFSEIACESMLYLFLLIMFSVIAVRNYILLCEAELHILPETVSARKREIVFNTIFLSLCFQGIFFNHIHTKDYAFQFYHILQFSETSAEILGNLVAIVPPVAVIFMQNRLCKIRFGTLPVMQKKKRIKTLRILNIIFLTISLCTIPFWISGNAHAITVILLGMLLYQNIRSRKTLAEPDKNSENPAPVVRMLPVPEQQAAVNMPVQSSEPETEDLREKLRSYEQEISRQKEIISQQQKQIAEYHEKSSVPAKRILTFAPLSETEIKKLSE